MTQRIIERIFPALTQQEGAGATVHRTIGRRDLSVLDPFLLLDEFELGVGAGGFPDHPHRGFETLTYMFTGKMEHKDNKGGGGVIGVGDAQWMTAGRGVVHSEMPISHNGEIAHGMQLWVNLPAKDKMQAPAYRDVTAENLVIINGEKSEIRLVAGTYGGQRGPVSGLSLNPIYMDVHLKAGGTVTLDIPSGHNGFLYPVLGEIQVGEQQIGTRDLAVLTDGDSVTITALSDSRIIAAAAVPTGEPVARYGPFVMNTKAEIQQAIDDFNDGKF